MMMMYFDLVNYNLSYVGLEESNYNYNHDSHPIRWAWVGKCIVAHYYKSGLVLIGPSKGAAYIANKKMARKIRHADFVGRIGFVDEPSIKPIRATIKPHLSEKMTINEIEKIIKGVVL